MAKPFVCGLSIVAFLMAQLAIGSAQQAGNPHVESAAPLRIGPGDLIDVAIFDNPDLSGHFRVDEKGEITLPLVGRVRLEGETAEEAATTIEQQYVQKEILTATAAHASVFISEYATQGILVNGEVKLPGLYPALGIRMFNDVMTAAGGVTPNASSKVVITRKSDPGNPITVEYIPEAQSPVVPRVQIFPGDTITVPFAGSVYLLGSVSRSGLYILEGRHVLTVEKAMALAGGTTRGANTGHSHIVRTLEDGRKEDIVFNVSLILKGKAPDLALKDGDILYIPTSNIKLGVMQAINSAIGIGTSVVTYRTAFQ
jgi:polysaccharide export outer membrane protein